ncbi:MAG: efflux RND transporter periplasmic adaptor subunit [Prochlorothrix sp.]
MPHLRQFLQLIPMQPHYPANPDRPPLPKSLRRQVLGLGLASLLFAGCGGEAPKEAEAPQGGGGGPRGQQVQGGSVTVDVAIAAAQTLEADLEYTGLTEPRQRIELRAQVQGQLVGLGVDVGDRVRAGETIGQLDATLLQADLVNAQAERASQQFEQAEAQSELAEVQAQYAEIQAQLEQAAIDAQRLQQLATEGAVSQQAAEQGETKRRSLEASLKSLTERIRTRQQAIQVAAAQVAAQEAIVRQAQERLTYAQLKAPQDGVVMERLVDPGDLVQPGQAVLSLGDFAELQVRMEVSDLDIRQIRPGQQVSITLDAVPGATLPGLINRIAPIASNNQQIPIEVRMPNPQGQLGAGLLARITVPSNSQPQIVVPESALEVGAGETKQVFVVVPQPNGEGETVVEARSVRVGRSSKGQVEILEGLNVGEVYVVRSASPLEAGQVVQRSLLSETTIKTPAS